ncbi:MAG TPA: M12 family metallo-peptidase [Opitutaceae bacterium]|nr:M12 family metallo-peptidase [Opitutaceae bacterium]
MKKSVSGSIITFAAAAGILFLSAVVLHSDRVTAVPNSGAADTHAPRILHRAVTALAPAEIAALAAASVTTLPRETRQPARADIAAILPDAAAAVADWREFIPASIRVQALPNLPLEFTAASVSNDGRRTTWIGVNPEQGATMVACGTETLWNAIITVPGADEISIQITPETVRVFEHTRSLAVCGDADSTLARSSAAMAAAQLASAATTGTTSAATYTADVLILYDAATKAAIGTTAEVENTFAAMVATMNTYLNNSLIDNLQWRLAGIAEAPSYTTNESLENDLDTLADTTTELGRFARTQRTNFGADQVLLMISGSRDYAGMAYTPGYEAVAVYAQGTAVAAHELAHNFGCHHDRQTEGVADGNGRYYYGHRFTYNDRDVGTIMSYAPYYIPYYSNPSVSYQGIPTGIASTEPKAADNARWLREHAADVANLVAPRAYVAPAITTQPANITINAGQTLSLSVEATGDRLSYQWYKGGAAISGAASASYSKTATTADAGTYYVTVGNSLGTVTSNSVTVTVNATTNTGSGTGSSNASSGGGGGGALELLGTLGLATLLGLRVRLRR